MSKIIGVTVGTTISPDKIKEKLKPVLSVNGVKPDEDGNVKIATYNGEYQVTPRTGEDVTLLTADTFVDANIKVKKIPFAEVSNNSGGTTVTIGNEV